MKENNNVERVVTVFAARNDLMYSTNVDVYLCRGILLDRKHIRAMDTVEMNLYCTEEEYQSLYEGRNQISYIYRVYTGNGNTMLPSWYTPKIIRARPSLLKEIEDKHPDAVIQHGTFLSTMLEDELCGSRIEFKGNIRENGKVYTELNLHPSFNGENAAKTICFPSSESNVDVGPAIVHHIYEYDGYAEIDAEMIRYKEVSLDTMIEWLQSQSFPNNDYKIIYINSPTRGECFLYQREDYSVMQITESVGVLGDSRIILTTPPSIIHYDRAHYTEKIYSVAEFLFEKVFGTEDLFKQFTAAIKSKYFMQDYMKIKSMEWIHVDQPVVTECPRIDSLINMAIDLGAISRWTSSIDQRIILLVDGPKTNMFYNTHKLTALSENDMRDLIQILSELNTFVDNYIDEKIRSGEFILES